MWLWVIYIEKQGSKLLHTKGPVPLGLKFAVLECWTFSVESTNIRIWISYHTLRFKILSTWKPKHSQYKPSPSKCICWLKKWTAKVDGFLISSSALILVFRTKLLLLLQIHQLNIGNDNGNTMVRAHTHTKTIQRQCCHTTIHLTVQQYK